MKALKNLGFGPRKSKSGFTLIELLIVMVILAILAGVVVMAVGGVFGTAKSAAYNAVKDDIQNAVTAYATDHQGNFPINESAAYAMIANTNCSSCYIINMSALLVANGGMLRQYPDGLASAGALANVNSYNNCYGDSSPLCKTTSHYTWGTTTKGVVFSRCDPNSTGDIKNCVLVTGGSASNNSGYQGVWP